MTHESTAFDLSLRAFRARVRPCACPEVIFIGLFWILFCVFPVVICAQPPAESPIVDRAQHEAMQRYIFLQQTALLCTWPESTFIATNDASVIVVLGRVTHLEILEKLLSRRKTVHDHPIVVKRADDPSKIPACQVLFITADVAPDVQRKAINLFRGKPVLLIGETSDFTSQGGCIGLISKSGIVQREFNTIAIRTQSVVVDLRLQKGGRFVETAPDQSQPGLAPRDRPPITGQQPRPKMGKIQLE